MNIRKPHSIILSKKYPDRYFDWETHEEFPYEEINHYPRWYKYEYDNNGNKIYAENNVGNWAKWEYDNNGKETYWENWYGGWEKLEYGTAGELIYYENSDGVIKDNRI